MCIIQFELTVTHKVHKKALLTFECEVEAAESVPGEWVGATLQHDDARLVHLHHLRHHLGEWELMVSILSQHDMFIIMAYCFLLCLVAFVFVRDMLSWCPKTSHCLLNVCDIFSLNSIDNINLYCYQVRILVCVFVMETVIITKTTTKLVTICLLTFVYICSSWLC